MRDLTFKSAREKQLATWNTAMALYELEVQSGLWSRRSMLTPDDQRQFDLSPSGSDDALGYFVAEMPAEWRAQKLKQLEKLESELYRLFSGLNELDAANILPRSDPGRWWLPKAFIGKDASLAIAPNQADFEAWKKGQLASVLERRHGRSLLFNYYLNFAKRAIVITMAAQLAMAAPQVTQLPGYMEAVISLSHFNQELDEAPAKSEDLNKKYLENLRAMVTKEEARLKREIEKQEGQANPDAPALNELKAELKDLYDNYPWLLY